MYLYVLPFSWNEEFITGAGEWMRGNKLLTLTEWYSKEACNAIIFEMWALLRTGRVAGSLEIWFLRREYFLMDIFVLFASNPVIWSRVQWELPGCKVLPEKKFFFFLQQKSSFCYKEREGESLECTCLGRDFLKLQMSTILKLHLIFPFFSEP